MKRLEFLFCWLLSFAVGLRRTIRRSRSAAVNVADQRRQKCSTSAPEPTLTDQIIWIEGDRIKAIGKAAEIQPAPRRRQGDRSLESRPCCPA